MDKKKVILPVEGWFDISFSPLQERLREEGWNEEIKGRWFFPRSNRGKKQSRNGRSITLTTLKEVASHLVDIYGQGENNRFHSREQISYFRFFFG